MENMIYIYICIWYIGVIFLSRGMQCQEIEWPVNQAFTPGRWQRFLGSRAHQIATRTVSPPENPKDHKRSWGYWITSKDGIYSLDKHISKFPGVRKCCTTSVLASVGSLCELIFVMANLLGSRVFFSLDTYEISHCCSMSTEAHTKYTIHRSEMEGMLLAFILTIDLRRNARKACDEDGEVHVSSGVARLLFMVI